MNKISQKMKSSLIIMFTIIILIAKTTSSSASSGLFYYDQHTHSQSLLPLKNITYNVEIEDSIARVELIQYYYNDRPNTIDTEYNFPISDSAVFDKFSAKIDNKVLVGKIMKKENAKHIYREQKQQGHTVAYSEITSGADIMNIKVGNINSHDTIEIKFSYIEPLDVYLNTFWRFKLYSTVNPRYEPVQKTAQRNVDIVNSSELMYQWFVNVRIRSENAIKKLEVPSHESNIIKNTISPHEITLIFNPDSKLYPNKDFELYFSTENQFKPKISLEQHPEDKDSYIGTVNFFPKFNEFHEETIFQHLRKMFSLDNPADSTAIESQLNVPANIESEIQKAKAEFLFIIDRSGSMGGDKIENLRITMQNLIKILPEQSYFNIYNFGSSFDTMFPTSVLVSENRLNAISKLSSIEANYGGTEILSPIQAALNSSQLKGFPKVIYLLTDGEVSNSDQIIQLVNQSTSKARVFSVGIGTGISPHFIKNVGLRGEGGYEFVKDSSNLEEKTKQMVFKMISPFLSEFQINFQPSKFLSNTRPDIEKIPYLVKNESFKFFFFLNKSYFGHSEENLNLSVIFKYFNSYENKFEEFKLSINKDKAIHDDKLHKLAYKSIIEDNKYERVLQDHEIIDISTKYQVLCDKTAFILVLKKNEKRPNNVDSCNIPNHTPLSDTNKENQDINLSVNGKNEIDKLMENSIDMNSAVEMEVEESKDSLFGLAQGSSQAQYGHYESAQKQRKSKQRGGVISGAGAEINTVMFLNQPTGIPGAMIVSEKESLPIQLHYEKVARPIHDYYYIKPNENKASHDVTQTMMFIPEHVDNVDKEGMEQSPIDLPSITISKGSFISKQLIFFIFFLVVIYLLF